MKDFNTCKTCKHFLSPQNLSDGTGSHGQCRKAELTPASRNEGDRPFFAADENGHSLTYQGYLFVKPNFGCIEWEIR